jgi:hypothetical protein
MVQGAASDCIRCVQCSAAACAAASTVLSQHHCTPTPKHTQLCAKAM